MNRPPIHPSRIFDRAEILALLNGAMGKTLLEVDSRHLFTLFGKSNKVTGIAGDIVEQSVLGCEPDNRQDVDIYIGDTGFEVKTTGMVISKDSKSPYRFECKEPVSITAVSIPKIVDEDFESSNFWHKLEHLLWVYYWYKSDTPVKLNGYKNFILLSFQLFEFDDADCLRLKHDWVLVRNFLIAINNNYHTDDERKSQYPRLSSELRGVLLVIDTAPKYPNPPRFRLKRDFATEIAGSLFLKKKKVSLEKLAKPILDYSEIDIKCSELNSLYSGKTFDEIANSLGVTIRRPKMTAINDANTIKEEVDVKNFAELVVLRMFGSSASRLNKIDDFVKIGLIAKSLPLKQDGKPKESMKLFTPNFNEWIEESSFEDSFLHDYFCEHQFLFIVYQYYPDGIRFKGFKRIVIPDAFIYNDVRKFWTDVRSLIKEKRLCIDKKFRKSDGSPIMNKSGEQSEAPNFPKEKEYNVFMRGSAKESIEKLKSLEINGLRMIPQEIWLSKRATINLYQDQ